MKAAAGFVWFKAIPSLGLSVVLTWVLIIAFEAWR